jgi:hypothetical protein
MEILVEIPTNMAICERYFLIQMQERMPSMFN